MEIQLLDLINILTPIVSLVAGWFFGRKKQKNDFLSDLQSSVDMLAGKNKELLEEVVNLREENVKLRIDVEELSRKLEGVTTITKKLKSNKTLQLKKDAK